MSRVTNAQTQVSPCPFSGVEPLSKDPPSGEGLVVFFFQFPNCSYSGNKVPRRIRQRISPCVRTQKVQLKVRPMQLARCHHCEMELTRLCLAQQHHPERGFESPSFLCRSGEVISARPRSCFALLRVFEEWLEVRFSNKPMAFSETSFAHIGDELTSVSSCTLEKLTVQFHPW